MLFLMIGCSGGGIGTPVAPAFEPLSNPTISEETQRGSLTDLASTLNANAGLGSAYWSDAIKIGDTNWVADYNPDDHSLTAFGKPVDIKTSVEQFIDSHPEIFLVSSNNLWLMSDEIHEGMRYIIYRQAFNGIPILDSRIDLRFNRNGKLIMVAVDAFPEIQDVPSAYIGHSQAVSIASSRYSGDVCQCELYITLNSNGSFIPIWRTFVGSWYVLISAIDGSTIYEKELVWNYEFYGNVRGYRNQIDPYDDPVESGMLFNQVQFFDPISQVYVGNTYCDLLGQYTFNSNDYTELLTKVMIFGKWVDVDNKFPGHLDAEIQKNTQQGVWGNFIFNFNPPVENCDDTEANVFCWTNWARNRITNSFNGIDPTFTKLNNIQITANVNFDVCPDKCGYACAGWSYESGVYHYSINFAVENACGTHINAGRIPDAIIHEYGHIVTMLHYDMEVYPPKELPPGDLGEGFSDYFANTITNQPLIGYGIYGPGSNLRNSENTFRLGQDCPGNAEHCLGNILAGALWDLREVEGATVTDKLWWLAKWGKPQSFQRFALEMCLADDNYYGDGDPSNGTPNYWDIRNAFWNKHSIPVPPPRINLKLEVTPDNEPIIIDPKTGGSFNYNIQITNLENTSCVVDGWVDIWAPEQQSWYGPVIPPSYVKGTPVKFYLSGNQHFSFNTTQNIPSGVLQPDKTYYYHIRLGNRKNGVIWADEAIIFTTNINTTGDGNLIWAKRAGGANMDYGSGITTLSDNSAVVTGRFDGSVTFGPGEPNETILNGGGFFIARYKPDGTLAWAKQTREPDTTYYGSGITTLSDNSIAVTGYFSGTTTFGHGEPNETVLNGWGFFIARYNPDGTLTWAKKAGQGEVDGNAITTLSDNSTVATGRFYGSATFGPDETNQTVLTSAGGFDIFIARYNPNGTLAWAKPAGGPGGDRIGEEGLAITTLSDNSTTVTGDFFEIATFGLGEQNQTVLTSIEGQDIFIARYNPNGTLSWAKSAEGTGFYDFGFGITTLSDNSTVVTGIFTGTTTFGPDEPNETILSDGGFFIARYNPTGTLAWAKQAGDPDLAYGYGITTLSDNSSVVTGDFFGTATFGQGEPNQTVLASAGGSDIFVARYNLDGTLAWAKRAGGLDDGDCGSEITTLSDNSTVATGMFYGYATFGSGEPNQTVLTSAGGGDIFIARFAP